jgi:hypothetical protein
VLLVFGHPRDGEVVTAQELVENLLARVHLDASVSFDSTHEGSRSESAEASGHLRRSDRRRRDACSNRAHDSIIDDFRLYFGGVSTSSFTDLEQSRVPPSAVSVRDLISALGSPP